MRTNWQKFKELLKQRKSVYGLPVISVVSDRSTNYTLHHFPETAGYYDFSTNTIFVDSKCDCAGLRFHERGHWINRLIYNSLEIAWEFIWWGLSVRNLFVKIDQGEKK